MAEEIDLTELVRRHQASVWRYLRFLGCPEALADDLTQETFLKLLEPPPEQPSRSQTSAWLRTVARNHYLMALRRSSKLESVENIDELDAAWESSEGNDEGESYRLALRECLKTLAERARRAIDLQYSSEASRADIARSLGMDPEGAKTLLRRAREHLRHCIEKRLRP